MLRTTIIRTSQNTRFFLFYRSLSTEPNSDNTSSQSVPLSPNGTNSPTPRHRTRLTLQPRPLDQLPHASALQQLPPSFGRNQQLSVSKAKRALLESIVAKFNAPIRYAFAYGSGVFEQDGYDIKSGDPSSGPMLDFIFAVTHPPHWHSMNLQQHPSHYPSHARLLGSDFIAAVQKMGPGVWFNTYVQMEGVNIKYGVVSVDTLSSDLLNWDSLYLAGRMHKPVRIINLTPHPRITLNQQVNLASAARYSLLTLPEEFSETEFFERIASLSYMGDPRMLLPAENRGKVKNIVAKQSPQFKELYQKLVAGLPGVEWPLDSADGRIKQDVSPRGRAAHLKKLPSNLLRRVEGHFSGKEADESAYWVKVASDEKLSGILTSEISKIIRYPATVQSVKGIVSAGFTKSTVYTAGKIHKWWKGK